MNAINMTIPSVRQKKTISLEWMTGFSQNCTQKSFIFVFSISTFFAIYIKLRTANKRFRIG